MFKIKLPKQCLQCENCRIKIKLRYWRGAFIPSRSFLNSTGIEKRLNVYCKKNLFDLYKEKTSYHFLMKYAVSDNSCNGFDGEK